MIIGLDLGYGYTKMVTTGPRVAFPSVTGNVEEVKFSNDMIGTGGGPAIVYDGHSYCYGEMALLQSRMVNTLLDRSRVGDVQVKLLCLAGLVELWRQVQELPSESLWLLTGLPVEFYKDRTILQEQLKGYHHIEVDGKVVHFSVDKAKVVPQPFGSLFSMILGEGGTIVNEDLAQSSVGVIDTGTYTTDLVVMRPDAEGKPAYIEVESGSEEVGVSKALELTRRDIGSKFPSLAFELHDVDKALMAGGFNVRGVHQDITPFANPHLAEVASRILTKAKELWGEGLGLDKILVTGGGGALFFPTIKAFYSHAELVAEPFWANAIGFLRYGQRPQTFAG